MKWKLRSCPRCGGDIFIEKDLSGWWYETCLQCGYRCELKGLEEFEQNLVRKKQESHQDIRM